MRTEEEISEYIEKNKYDWDKVNYKTRRRNGLTIFTGPSSPHLTKISAEEWNDIVYYIEDLEQRIEDLERRVGK